MYILVYAVTRKNLLGYTLYRTDVTRPLDSKWLKRQSHIPWFWLDGT